MPSHKRVLLSFFYRLGEWESKRPRIRKHISPHAATAKWEVFFFHSTWPSSHNTQAQKHTVTHQHTHSLLSLNSCGNISGFFWLCFQYRLAMHLHTDSVILPFSVSCVPVTVAGRGSSAAPTWRGINGVAVVEATHPRSCDGVLACFNPSLLVLLKLILISVWLNQLGHTVCVYFWVNVCLQLWGLVLCFYNGGAFKTTWWVWIYRSRQKMYSFVYSFSAFFPSSEPLL